jgi:hypothetical protein
MSPKPRRVAPALKSGRQAVAETEQPALHNRRAFPYGADDAAPSIGCREPSQRNWISVPPGHGESTRTTLPVFPF